MAGFKSFVDPTTIRIDGQLASIVGPNGCGKSNVVESVKWVMGSSSAKELRGESMDSIIFRGTDTRQPLSRASVELIFDNTEGRAPTEWSSYAEISIKRVIEKEKGSSYLINNTVVRRKDVADLFLGTGLGSKGYAIIGQNKITEIVEAKPEEIKGYLEEAAGVSKYKERRKETEYRLRDTKENLTRVNDLISEINSQVTRLKSQAATANKYQKYQEDLKFSQAQVWALKKQKTNETWNAIKQKIDEQTLQLDQFIAKLRELEASVEVAREAYSETSEEINTFQAKFYEVNAIVSEAENSLTNIKNNIERFTLAKADSLEKIKKISLLEEEVNNEIEESKRKSGEESSRLESHEKLNNEDRDKLVQIQDLLSGLTSQYEKARNDRNYKSNELRELSQQRIEKARNDRNYKSNELRELSQQRIEKARNDRDVASKELNETEVRISSLKDFIHEDKSSDSLDEWLKNSSIENKQPVIDQLIIKEGWDAAFGYYLVEYLNAYEGNLSGLKNRPSKTITLINKKEQKIALKLNDKLVSATSVIEAKDNYINNAINEWLSNVYLANNDSLEIDRGLLSYGDILILKNGDIYGKTYQIIRSENGANINVLARKKQLDELELKHPVTLEVFKKSEQDLSAIQAEVKAQEESFNNKSEQDLSAIQAEVKAQEESFNNQRNRLFESDKLKQEIEFNIKLLKRKIDELLTNIENKVLEKNRLEKVIEESVNELKNNSVNKFESELKEKIKSKEQAEHHLTIAREKLSTKDLQLKEVESQRLQKQQSLDPIQTALQETKIEERELKVNFEQCCESLDRLSIDESELLSKINIDDTVSDLEEKSNKISARIDRLGPVNLAAIGELETIEERKIYVQKQMEDLVDASNTLEQAIKKIDIETREKLDKTYLSVNENFNYFFQKLFKGGKAELKLMGKEILDTGFEIFAQPPGLKNTTIATLSGGQQALTASALVFALFKLNPAPFCFMDEVDAPLDDSNVENFCTLVKEMSERTQIILVSHNKQTMTCAEQLIGVTSLEKGVSRIVEVNTDQVESVG